MERRQCVVIFGSTFLTYFFITCVICCGNKKKHIPFNSTLEHVSIACSFMQKALYDDKTLTPGNTQEQNKNKTYRIDIKVPFNKLIYYCNTIVSYVSAENQF